MKKTIGVLNAVRESFPISETEAVVAILARHVVPASMPDFIAISAGGQMTRRHIETFR